MTVKVTYGNNMKRGTELVEDTMTPRQLLEEKEINYATGITTLDGAPLGRGDLDRSFAELGITDKCYLLCVVKADNAR